MMWIHTKNPNKARQETLTWFVCNEGSHFGNGESRISLQHLKVQKSFQQGYNGTQEVAIGAKPHKAVRRDTETQLPGSELVAVVGNQRGYCQLSRGHGNRNPKARNRTR